MKPGKDCIGVSVFALVFNSRNEFLLIRTRPSEKKSKEYNNIWSMPGGTIEFGETVNDALVREIFEETGLKIQDIKFLCYNDFIRPDEGKHWVSLNFKAFSTDDHFTSNDTTEIKECSWFNFKNVPENISQFTKKCLEIVRKESKEL